jgi:hypothetical protein
MLARNKGVENMLTAAAAAVTVYNIFMYVS